MNLFNTIYSLLLLSLDYNELLEFNLFQLSRFGISIYNIITLSDIPLSDLLLGNKLYNNNDIIENINTILILETFYFIYDHYKTIKLKKANFDKHVHHFLMYILCIMPLIFNDTIIKKIIIQSIFISNICDIPIHLSKLINKHYPNSIFVNILEITFVIIWIYFRHIITARIIIINIGLNKILIFAGTGIYILNYYYTYCIIKYFTNKKYKKNVLNN